MVQLSQNGKESNWNAQYEPSPPSSHYPPCERESRGRFTFDDFGVPDREILNANSSCDLIVENPVNARQKHTQPDYFQ